jgi:hypothetical protein
MTPYLYRCAQGHESEQRFPLGQAPREQPCPACQQLAVRQWSPCHIRRPSRTTDSDDTLTRWQFANLG